VADDKLSREYDTVNLYRRDNGAVRIELNRPDRMNAWNAQFAADLIDALQVVTADTAARAVLITGAGRAFSSGADIRDSTLNPADADLYGRLTEQYHPIINAVRHMPKPVVAAVNGPAAGIGASLALSCDLVVAAESAYFLLAFVNIGLVPDGGSSLLIPSRIGFARAAELAMLGERLPAAKAVEWGLINRAWPDAEFTAEADALLDRLAVGPTLAYAGAKRQLNRWVYEHMADQLEFEASVQREMGGSADFIEGVTAFAEKRPPRFTGA
jgi:2-(1,2-epoxy-1,2-dihydrophenyl)acetyl-CoA isomerase